MRQPVILQIQGLGIPVLLQNVDGSAELRWSSDPDIKADTPAYLFRDSAQIKQFMINAIDRRFVNETSMIPIRVEAPDDAVTLSRVDAERQGINSSNWECVRAGLIITGNSIKGPVSDAMEWFGDREDYDQGQHLLEAFQHAKRHDISSPIIVPHNEIAHTINAAEFMTKFHHSIKPQLLCAHQIFSRLSSELHALDIAAINPERAVRILAQLKDAITDVHAQDNRLRESIGVEPKAMMPVDPTPSGPAPVQNEPATAPTVLAVEPEPEPHLFRSPRLG